MPLHQITPEDELLRRIILQPQFFKITPDGVRRPTSAAFKMRSGEDGLSVDILGLTTLEQAIANRSTHTGLFYRRKYRWIIGARAFTTRLRAIRRTHLLKT
jgi:hypothetical protein